MLQPKSMTQETMPDLDWRAADAAAEKGDFTLLDEYNCEAKRLAPEGTFGHIRIYPGFTIAETTARIENL